MKRNMKPFASILFPDQLGLPHFVRFAKKYIYIIDIYFHRKTTSDVFPYMNVEKSNLMVLKKTNTMKLTIGGRVRVRNYRWRDSK